MTSTPKLRRSAWRRGGLFGVLLFLLAITFLGSSTVSGLRSREHGQISPVLVAAAESTGRPEMLRCPAGTVAITRADVGIGNAARCLPVGGAKAGQSRIDPVYGRVATGLTRRIAGRAEAFAGDVNVICWSKDDWRSLTDAFTEAGQIEPPGYWLGWVRGNRGVINLSYPACKQ